MRIQWTARSRMDLRRVHDFLAPKNPRAAAAVLEAITEAPNRLLLQPRIGQRIETITGREVRRILIGDYELRYVLIDEDVRISRIFHALEDR